MAQKILKYLPDKKNFLLLGLIFIIILTVMTILYASITVINYFQQTNFSLVSIEDNPEKNNETKF